MLDVIAGRALCLAGPASLEDLGRLKQAPHFLDAGQVLANRGPT